MKTIMFLSVCAISLSGCWSKQARTGKSPDDETRQMIQIQSFVVGKTALALHYRVTNVFPYDIWFCEDTTVYDRNHNAETRIIGETLVIRLRLDEDIDFMAENVLAKYARLTPGHSYSGVLNLELPIRDFCAVRGFRDFGKELKQVTLNRTVFELGYFERDLLKVLTETIKRGRADPDFTLALEEIQHKNSQNTAYLTYLWKGLRRQKSVKITLADLEIPCSVAVDDRSGRN